MNTIPCLSMFYPDLSPRTSPVPAIAVAQNVFSPSGFRLGFLGLQFSRVNMVNGIQCPA